MRISLSYFRERRQAAFSYLNATQFFGALNDNVFKGYLQMFILGVAATKGPGTLAVATIVFALPYLFLTSYGGFLADRFSKKTVTVALKYTELGIMVLALPAFIIGYHWILFVLLLLMSAQSALFSPTKYSIIPEIVKTEKLSKANGVLVASSFMAIIIGAALSPLIAMGLGRAFGADPVVNKFAYKMSYAVAQLVCVLIAVAGILTSHRVVPLHGAKPDLHPDWLFPRKMAATWAWVRKDRELAMAMWGSWMFSMVASFLQINLVIYGMNHMALNEKSATFLAFYAAIGIASGALLSGRLSKRNIEFGTMPGGAFLLAVATFVLGFLPENPNAVLVPIMIFTAGLGAGLFVVPLDTFLQFRLPASRRGEGLALNNFLSWAGILFSGVLLYVLHRLGAAGAAGFLIIGFPTMLMALVCFFSLKDFAFRFFVTCAVKLLYKVRTIGAENVPVAGPAVLLANHASYMDSVLLCATSRRRIRFLMSAEMYHKNRLLKKFYDLYGVIPVSAKSSPREIASALRAAREALDDGFMVCVFPEGGITRTGTIRAFKRGYERIIRGTNYPIIPVYIGGSWGTIYHYYRGQLVRRWFRNSLGRYPVTLLFGKRLPPDTDAFHVRRAVMELSCDYFNARKAEHASLAKTMISRLRRAWGENLANDSMALSLTSGKALIASIAVSRAIEPRLKPSD
ncbi:MAG: MFS transporter, partial [Kiritimatiellaeota bacterium]|nr:MFS transporter [Kiritimatiellota bacterium]